MPRSRLVVRMKRVQGSARRILRFLADEAGPYLRTGDRKPLWMQIREMAALQREYGAVPYHYVSYSLYRRSHAGRVLDYLPVDQMMQFSAALNPAEGIPAASDKLLFAHRMRAAGIPVPQHLAVLRRGDILDAQGHALSFVELIERLRSECQDVFIKLRECSGGIGALRVPVAELERLGWQGLRQRLWGPKVTPWSEYLVQRVIVQHPVLAALASTSINTVRIDTYLEGDMVHFNAAVLRVGDGRGCTDNWSNGGLIARIDLSSGRVRGNGHRRSKFGKAEFSRHPVTGARFDGLALPYWHELTAIVQSAARLMAPLRSLGWDVAITPQGPLIVEVNHDYEVNTSQYLSDGYRNTPFGQALLSARRSLRPRRPTRAEGVPSARSHGV